ncbi:hypothetical protein MCOR02_007996 [Pyricularia oryzae]|nr:hypothetical protein MCOR02_007996 [Pyricularia oryzae]
MAVTVSRASEPTQMVRKDSAVDLGSPTPLPVTLLSGFLGSGKTTLLQHILRSDHGLRIAVIVNDIGAVNVDANLINHHVTQTTEKVIALQNGCICCTLRGDLLEELVRLSELHTFDYVIVESSGISEPEQVAETFDSKLAETMGALGDGSAGAEGALDEAMQAVLKKLADAGGVGSFARLDTTVTVIDAFTIMNDFHTDQLLSSRRGDVGPEDERTVSDLMVDQIEFADVIVLNKTDMVDRATKQRVIDLITKLNHRAKVIETSHGKVDVKAIVNTGLFDLEHAQTGYGWLQDLHELTLREVNGRKTITPNQRRKSTTSATLCTGANAPSTHSGCTSCCLTSSSCSLSTRKRMTRRRRTKKKTKTTSGRRQTATKRSKKQTPSTHPPTRPSSPTSAHPPSLRASSAPRASSSWRRARTGPASGRRPARC